MLNQTAQKIILASKSASRADMLRNAGLNIETIPADIDEASVRAAMDGSEPADIAEVLARLKTEAVSTANPSAMVVGADQILALGDEIFEKPKDMEEARDSLLKLRGKSHRLISAVALAKDGETIWTEVDTAQLTMRDLAPEYIGQYLSAAGEKVCSSVGAYQLEGLGVNLFSKIEGDYFTILGMPLIPLLNFLREKEILPS